MIDFYATIVIENDDQRKDFLKDLSRNNITVKAETPDGANCYHYALQGQWSGYEVLLKISSDRKEDHYKLTSLEHFED